MIVTTEAIVLKSMKYGETSRIVSLYTREHGKVSVIAKGARAAKSKYGAALEPMSYSQVVYYRKENRDLQTLSQADLLAQFRGVIDDPDKLVVGFALIEYIQSVIHGEEAHERLFDALHRSLTSLNAIDRNPRNVLLRFLLDLCQELGFGIDISLCLGCRQPLRDDGTHTHVKFDAQDGGFTCGRCIRSAGGVVLAESAFLSLRRLAESEPDRLNSCDTSKTGAALLRLLDYHLRTHIPDARKVHSLDLFEDWLH